MNKYLYKACMVNTPELSPIAKGFAGYSLEHGPQYLDLIIKSALDTVPPEVATYEGFMEVKPDEWFRALIKRDELNSRPKYDTSMSYFTPYKFKFTYRGKEFFRYYYIMYLDKGNILVINNAKYFVLPVLSDTVLSARPDSIFMRLSKEKHSIERFIHTININGERRVSSLLWYRGFHASKKTDIITPLTLYGIGEFGLRGFLNRLGLEPREDIMIGTTDKDIEGYTKYTSSNIPGGAKLDRYRKNDIVIHLKTDIITPYIESIATTLIYVGDVISSYSGMLNKPQVFDLDTGTWRTMIARLLSRDEVNLSRAYNEVDLRYKSLKHYLDYINKKKLEEIGIHCNDFYDLIEVITNNFKKWTNEAKKGKDNFLTTRHLDVLYYLFYDGNVGMNRTMLELLIKDQKNVANGSELTIDEVMKTFINNAPPKVLQRINGGKNGGNIAVNLVDSSTDLRYFKITAPMELQEAADGVQKSSNQKFPYTVSRISASHAFIGTVTYPPKNRPSGIFRSNIYAPVDVETGRFLFPIEVKKKCEILDVKLKQVQKEKNESL